MQKVNLELLSARVAGGHLSDGAGLRDKNNKLARSWADREHNRESESGGKELS